MSSPQHPGVAGVAFPPTEDGRSTSAAGRSVLASAAAAVDAGLAAAILEQREWHKHYLHHVRALVAAELRASDADAVAQAGSERLHASFEFVREGQGVPLGDACELSPVAPLHHHRMRGRGDHGGLAVPYGGQLLEGDALRHRLARWVAAGVVEPSFAAAIQRVLDEPGWLELDDLTVVVLGAGAEMGPVSALSRWGATTVLVDLPRPDLWDRVLRAVEQGCGRAVVPTRRPLPADASHDEVAGSAGIDLVTGVPEVAAWLGELEGPLVLGSYVYADGADHVRAALAADALTAHLLERDAEVTVAGLLTPTDVYAVPAEVVEEARRRLQGAGPLRRAARTAMRGHLFAPNYDEMVTTPDGHAFGLADCLVPQQGPNYALAKRLQQWRYRLARRAGVPVSANVAPATRTRSVTSNRILAAAYAGAHRYGVEVFEPATSNVLLAALLVHDLRAADASGRPGTPLHHPLELFSEAAAHGGMWRQPYSPRSVLPLAAVAGLPRAR